MHNRDKNLQMIRLNNISKIYTRRHSSVAVLSGITLQIEKGEFVGFSGFAGSGKSTLLKIIGLLESPSGGEYYFMNSEIAHLSGNQRERLRKGYIGYVSKEFSMIDELTLFENIELPCLYLNMGSTERKQFVNAAMEKMNLLRFRNHYPRRLTRAQRRKAALARAISTGADLILADEPAGKLEPAEGDEILQILGRLNEEGKTIAMVVDSTMEAAYPRRLIRLHEGKIITENIALPFHK